MDQETALHAIIRACPERLRILRLVRDLNLADGWIAAGFVRSAVWDHLHGLSGSPSAADIDIIWFDPRATAQADADIEAALRRIDPGLQWSVKNQARMHLRNGDAPYASASEAMTHWPETATAVAVRLSRGDRLEVAAPLGLDDLFALLVRPTAAFLGDKHELYLARLAAKNWRARWPRLDIRSGYNESR